jgi:AsmA protein
MNRIVKCCIAVISFLFLLTATILVLPLVVDIQRFQPEIERKLSDLTGRSIKIGSNLGLSFVPTLNISFSDFKMGNPEGFVSDYFFKIDSFEARVNILSLLKKEIELSRFIVSGLEVNLEKRTDGRGNWNFSQQQNGESIISTSSFPGPGWSLPRNLSIGLFAVTDGTAILIDRRQNLHHRVEDLMLLLHNFTFNNSVEGEAKASIKGKSLAAEGKAGPFILKNEQGIVPFDLLVSFSDTFTGQVNGDFVNLAENQLYAFEIRLDPSSSKDFFESLNSASSKKMRAEFSELENVFSFRNDLIDNTETMLKTPFANILISGTADFLWNQPELLIEPEVLPNEPKEHNVGDSIGSGTVVKKQTGSGRILISPLQERHAWR